MSYEILAMARDKMVSWLPGRALRHHYSRERLDREIRFELAPPDRPMRYVLGSYVPLFIAELNVRNLTALTWQVHDFTVEVLALEQSFATAIAGRRPPTIRPRTDGALLAQCYLNEFQVRRLKERAQTATTMPTTLYIHAQLESKLGIVEFNPSINNMPAQIMR